MQHKTKPCNIYFVSNSITRHSSCKITELVHECRKGGTVCRQRQSSCVPRHNPSLPQGIRWVRINGRLRHHLHGRRLGSFLLTGWPSIWVAICQPMSVLRTVGLAPGQNGFGYLTQSTDPVGLDHEFSEDSCLRRNEYPWQRFWPILRQTGISKKSR